MRDPGPRQTNLQLLLLTSAATATGVLLFALGTRAALVAVILHGVTGLALFALTGRKWRIMRRGMAARPAHSTWPSVLLGVAVVVTVLTGLGHSSGLVGAYGPLGAMQVHVGAAVLATVLTVWHVVARRTVPGRRDLSRRNVLRAGIVLGAGAVIMAGTESAYRLTGIPGARRRFTGSLEQGSHAPEAMPSIIWLSDPRPVIAAATWHLDVVDHRGARRHRHPELAAVADRRTATIDCTVGWFAEQDWHGVRLDRLVEPDAGTRSIVVTSVTGYARRFPVEDLPHLLLATGYEGRALAPRHGFPARLVAPGRRGFWWVKWVGRIETSPDPWWRQPYFPLQ